MSENTTFARPYAKAVFNLALETTKLNEWSTILYTLALVAQDPYAQEFIQNPQSHVDLQCQLLLDILAHNKSISDTTVATRFVELLAQHKRLLLLPEIHEQFEHLRSIQEKSMVVSVKSFTQLTKDQEKQLIQALGTKLERHVTLEVSIDTTLLGGAIICAGDLVIDGSVRGKLNKLSADLAA